MIYLYIILALLMGYLTYRVWLSLWDSFSEEEKEDFIKHLYDNTRDDNPIY